ncbi:MAG: DUF222 domain-containing protein [Rhodoglobus sp.]
MTTATLTPPPLVVSGVSAVSALELRALSDDALMQLQTTLAERRRLIDGESALVAAEITERSRHELGYAGLAQKTGMRTPEALVQQLTGISGTDARTLVRVGTLMAEHSAPSSPERSWLRAVSTAVAAGRISLAAADAIRSGLGEPSESVSAARLAEGAASLVRDASSVTVERLAALARRLRDDIDEAGIAEREAQRRDRRFLTLTPLPDGMTRISGLLDPESAAVVVGAVDAITSPRRGGPRFVAEGESAHEPTDDSRTIPQIMVDALVDLVRVATLADDGALLGGRRVAVRVHVAERDLVRKAGAGFVEGQLDAVSIETIQRHLCESGAIQVLFGGNGHLDLGREQRLYTSRQRLVLAARDGGCRWPGCERPPGWCEAHHINEWARDGGKTDIADGVLLCRHHHMLLHNNGWRIEREGTEYWLVPPATGEGLGGERVAMPSKSPIRLTG